MSYSPDPGALPTGTPFIRQLSERDISLQIPVNYVTTPGVSLTPACFAHKRYEDAAASKCFSNLLAVGFNRFEIDIYWDVTRHLWSLCPVELGKATPDSDGTTSGTSTASTPTARLFVREADAHHWLEDDALARRQPDESTRSLSLPSSKTQKQSPSSSSSSISTTVTVSGTTAISTPGAPSPTNSGTLLRLGPYSCTSTINLSLFTKVLSGHLDSTQNNLNATLKYFLLRLHAAAPASDPTGSAVAPSESDLPKGNSLLSSILSSQMSKYLYTPDDLQSERSDLNSSASWYVSPRFQPDPSYFQVYKSDDHYATLDGWPSAGFVEMEYAKRLLAGYGQITPQMSGYNRSADASTIFPEGYLQRQSSATLNNAGEIESGCFYHPDQYSLAKVNSSWATSNDMVPLADTGGPLEPVLAAARNLTACGITPILNETLKGITADQNFIPYMDYVQSAVWSWAPRQPLNATHQVDDDASTNHRCAVLSAKSGRWQTETCAEHHYSACRAPGQIYDWAIGHIPASYTDANIPCPDGTDFMVPRTALENTYLVHKWRRTVAEKKLDDPLLWINFNDLDAAACWVIGQNTTCPYLRAESDDRNVVVPVVAAVIVFVLAALTVFVKCAANRQQTKRRRRRGDDGWDYEGVPS